MNQFEAPIQPINQKVIVGKLPENRPTMAEWFKELNVSSRVERKPNIPTCNVFDVTRFNAPPKRNKLLTFLGIFRTLVKNQLYGNASA